MKNHINFSNFPMLLVIITCLSCFKINAQTKLMHQSALSETHIAFTYAEDLWIANIDVSNPIRLTIDEGIESGPVFSPDGKHIAFNAQYDGNTDV